METVQYPVLYIGADFTKKTKFMHFCRLNSYIKSQKN